MTTSNPLRSHMTLDIHCFCQKSFDIHCFLRQEIQCKNIGIQMEKKFLMIKYYVFDPISYKNDVVEDKERYKILYYHVAKKRVMSCILYTKDNECVTPNETAPNNLFVLFVCHTSANVCLLLWLPQKKCIANHNLCLKCMFGSKWQTYVLFKT